MNMAKLVSFFNAINTSHQVDILAKEKLAKVADDVKASGRKTTIFSLILWYSCDRFSASNFAKDASKASQEYADEGLKQGQKLGEKAFEVGKDKGNLRLSFQWREMTMIFFDIYSQWSTQSCAKSRYRLISSNSLHNCFHLNRFRCLWSHTWVWCWWSEESS